MPDRESILAMEAGPELDALVAERVMGWTGVHDNSGGPPWGPMEGPRFVGSPSSQGVANRSVPAYSTDIAAAMGEVWLKLRSPTVSNCSMTCHGPNGTDIEESVFGASDIPAAICRAALLTTLARDVTSISTG